MTVRPPAAALVAAALLLAGCAGSDTGSDTGSGTGSGTGSDSERAGAAKSQAADVAWSPCDGLTAVEVSRLAGARVSEQTGTTDQPRCTFTPVGEGGPAYDVSYLWFDGGLDAALDSMGAIAQQLRPVEVPGADAARVAVKPRTSGILVTGFVQTGGLVQSVNAAQLAPYDEQRLVSSTTALLGALAAAAPPEE
ncbi:MAG: DUF3558 family protein [Nocardioides sp.]|nr:DUF3558 family protein [Nocardioidaceae bacterium]MCB8955576.1 DUF3558 family protein [Nocardioides sp.]